jgi:hypothetical protein
MSPVKENRGTRSSKEEMKKKIALVIKNNPRATIGSAGIKF